MLVATRAGGMRLMGASPHLAVLAQEGPSDQRGSLPYLHARAKQLRRQATHPANSGLHGSTCCPEPTGRSRQHISPARSHLKPLQVIQTQHAQQPWQLLPRLLLRLTKASEGGRLPTGTLAYTAHRVRRWMTVAASPPPTDGMLESAMSATIQCCQRAPSERRSKTCPELLCQLFA